jgi:hypothetical protein
MRVWGYASKNVKVVYHLVVSHDTNRMKFRSMSIAAEKSDSDVTIFCDGTSKPNRSFHC